jgi:hypothetical protein
LFDIVPFSEAGCWATFKQTFPGRQTERNGKSGVQIYTHFSNRGGSKLGAAWRPPLVEPVRCGVGISIPHPCGAGCGGHLAAPNPEHPSVPHVGHSRCRGSVTGGTFLKCDSLGSTLWSASLRSMHILSQIACTPDETTLPHRPKPHMITLQRLWSCINAPQQFHGCIVELTLGRQSHGLTAQ